MLNVPFEKYDNYQKNSIFLIDWKSKFDAYFHAMKDKDDELTNKDSFFNERYTRDRKYLEGYWGILIKATFIKMKEKDNNR